MASVARGSASAPGKGELGESDRAQRARPGESLGWCLITEDRDGAGDSAVDSERGRVGLERAGDLIERPTLNCLRLEFARAQCLTTGGRSGEGDDGGDGRSL
jgi:hypothetical protein